MNSIERNSRAPLNGYRWIFRKSLGVRRNSKGQRVQTCELSEVNGRTAFRITNLDTGKTRLSWVAR